MSPGSCRPPRWRALRGGLAQTIGVFGFQGVQERSDGPEWRVVSAGRIVFGGRTSVRRTPIAPAPPGHHRDPPYSLASSASAVAFPPSACRDPSAVGSRRRAHPPHHPATRTARAARRLHLRHSAATTARSRRSAGPGRWCGRSAPGAPGAASLGGAGLLPPAIASISAVVSHPAPWAVPWAPPPVPVPAGRQREQRPALAHPRPQPPRQPRRRRRAQPRRPQGRYPPPRWHPIQGREHRSRTRSRTGKPRPARAMPQQFFLSLMGRFPFRSVRESHEGGRETGAGLS